MAGRGLHLDKRNPKGQTALHVAVLSDDVEKGMTLLALGADPLIPDCRGRTPRQLCGSPASQALAQALAVSCTEASILMVGYMFRF